MLPTPHSKMRLHIAQALVALPNGWQVPACSEAESLFIYSEIAEQECYLQEGIHINHGDTVVDVGANIGQHNRATSAELY